MWFHVHHPPLAGVLLIFRSRYLLTIGCQGVFSLGRWASRIQSRFHVTGPTWVPNKSLHHFRVRDCHPLWSRFPSRSIPHYNKSHQALPHSLAATRRISFDFFSCRYLDVSVPHVRSSNLCIQLIVTIFSYSRVPPFGHLWLNARFQLAKAFRRIPRPSSPPTA